MAVFKETIRFEIAGKDLRKEIVEGDIIPLPPPYNEFRFAVHEGAFDSFGYTVSEITSGGMITDGHSTRSDAIIRFLQIIKYKTVEDLQFGITAVIKKRAADAVKAK